MDEGCRVEMCCGQVNHQIVASMGQILTPVLKDGWIIIQKNPAGETSHQAHIPQVTCASPCCHNFDQPFKASELRFSIEPQKNLAHKYVSSRPLADLATVRASPINGELNLRGKGENGCLWMHLTCAEYLGVGLPEHIDRMRTEPRSSINPDFNFKLEGPDAYSVLKWIAVVEGSKDLVGSARRNLWWKDSGLVAYRSQQEFDHAGWWKGLRIEVTARDVKDQPLSAVLAYTSVLKERALKLKAEQDSIGRLPRAVNPVVPRALRSLDPREEARELEEKKWTIEDDWEEVNNTLSSAAVY